MYVILKVDFDFNKNKFLDMESGKYCIYSHPMKSRAVMRYFTHLSSK